MDKAVRMETPLEMCDRHVIEAIERLARQDAMIAALDRSGRSDLAYAAREFRMRLVEFQADARRHGARLRAKPT
jgi:hypothetical protein